MAELLDKETRNIATIYADRTGQSADHWLEMMDKTSWLDAPEAVGCGLADFMYDPRTGPTSVLGTTETLKNAATVPYVGRGETRHVPTTTTHTHDHGAHGHPNHDDGIHSHSHSHSNDADHAHDHSQSDNDADDSGPDYYYNNGDRHIITNRDAADNSPKPDAASPPKSDNSADGFTDDDARTFANIMKGA